VRQLSAEVTNYDYANHVPLTRQLDHLILKAFSEMWPEGPRTRLLREAYRRLQTGQFEGDWTDPE